MYYKLNTICSYNDYNIYAIIGARGIGKTYAVKNYCIKNFIYKNKKFIWLRDTEESCEKLSSNKGSKFFSDIEKKFKLEKSYIIGENIIINNMHAGYLMPISTYYKYKGNNYNDIKTIVFDEFLPEMVQTFTKNRIRQFINSIDTIARLRTDVKIFMMSNALDKGNDIFSLFDINLTSFGLYKNKKKGVILHYADNDATFNKMREKSIASKLIKGTIFDDEIIQGKFNDSDNLYYNKKPEKCKIICIINDIRLYRKDNIFYCESDINKYAYVNLRYVSNFNMLNGKNKLINNEMKKYLIKAYESGNILFENTYIKNKFTEVLS